MSMLCWYGILTICYCTMKQINGWMIGRFLGWLIERDVWTDWWLVFIIPHLLCYLCRDLTWTDVRMRRWFSELPNVGDVRSRVTGKLIRSPFRITTNNSFGFEGGKELWNFPGSVGVPWNLPGTWIYPWDLRLEFPHIFWKMVETRRWHDTTEFFVGWNSKKGEHEIYTVYIFTYIYIYGYISYYLRTALCLFQLFRSWWHLPKNMSFMSTTKHLELQSPSNLPSVAPNTEGATQAASDHLFPPGHLVVTSPPPRGSQVRPWEALRAGARAKSSDISQGTSASTSEGTR